MGLLMSATGRAAAPLPTAESPKLWPAEDSPLPEGAVARLGTGRLRHGNHVWDVAFSPDGKRLASRGNDAVIRLWDVNTGKPVRVFDGFWGGESVAFSPDGTMLAAPDISGQESVVRLLDVATGAERRLEGMPPGVMAGRAQVALSPDGKVVAVTGPDCAIWLWDFATGRQIGRLDGHTHWNVPRLAFAPDGKVLASSGQDGTVRLWDVAARKALHVLRPEGDRVNAIVFARDGKTLFSAGGWKDEDDKPGAAKTGRAIRAWEVSTGKQLRARAVAAFAKGVCSLAVGPDGRTLAVSSDGKVVLWDLQEDKPLRRLPAGRNRYQSAWRLCFSPDGKFLAGGVGNAVYLWETASGRLLTPAPESAASGIRSLAVAGDGRLLAAAGQDGTIDVWDLPARRVRHRLATEPWGGSPVALSSDATRAAAFSREGDVLLFDMANGRRREHLSAQLGKDLQPNALTYSGDGKVLAVSYFCNLQQGGPRGIQLLDLSTGKVRQELRIANAVHGWFEALAFSPDGQRLTGTTVDSKTFRWRAAGNTFGAAEVVCPDHGFGSVAYSPAGWMAAADAYQPGIIVWDLEKKDRRLNLAGPANFGRVLLVSPDGRYLASAAGHVMGGDPKEVRDHTLWLYEMASGQEVLRWEFPPHTGVNSLAFAPDGRTLLTGMSDSTVLVWSVFPAAPRGPGGLPECWDDLTHDNAARAHRAAGALLVEGDRSVAFLAERLKPATAPPRARLARLLADLNSDTFAVREKATRELAKVAGAARADLERARAAAPSAEARRHIGRLLEGSGSLLPSGEAIRVARAVAVLEYVGTPAAQALLRRLSEGAPDAPLTAEAKAALQRLSKRQAPKR
jgi:WD40 repeat protein